MNKIAQSLYSRQGAVAAELAREFLQFKIGDRISKVTDYANKFGVGNGTIQAATQMLVDLGALRLESKGHKGTHVAAIDYLILWQATGHAVVSATMPLPYTDRLAGMATGLKHAFNSKNVPSALAFMRGVLPRVQALKTDRCDFIVSSRLSGELLCKEDPTLEIWCGFGPNTHVSDHVVLAPQGTNGQLFDDMRICVDKNSLDQLSLTQAEFRNMPVQFLDVDYMQIPTMLQRGEADAAVWSADEIIEKNIPLNMVPLRSQEAKILLQKCTEAVIVIQKQSGIGNFLNHVIDPKEVITVQEQVIHKITNPTF